MSENIFRNFYKNSRDYLFIIDNQGRIYEINPAVLTLGFIENELIGKDIFMLFPEEHKHYLVDFISKANSETTSTFFLPVKAKNNHFFPVESCILKGKWDNKDLLILVCRDVCGHRLSEERFYKIFNASQVLMAISTIDTGIFINVNQKFLSVLGYREDEIIGHSSQNLNLFYEYSQRQEVINQLESEGKIEDYEVKIRKKSGEMIYCNFSIERIQIQTHEFLLTSAIDISKLKEAENKLKMMS